ncbi:TetR/AcrR family transcriptional regulator [Amycolatopsis suaedae]|uniref:TetR/AcrR family transcriptional regulator n=2 Tax=Amycolatopsis suaedae TaxID=2510978 RepID=A0A4Q7J3U3_9PSEU|nr:TetR/AcrR family transcriptional regulator [Amycolatopsis suaedae]
MTAAERRAERRERLMDAGLEAFTAEGYAASSIEKLCAAAGVSTRNFYEEFSGREALLMALHDRIIERALVAAADALAEAHDAPLLVRVEKAIRAHMTVTAEDPRWARLSYVELVGVSAAVEQHRLAWRERWVDFLVAEAENAAGRGERPARDFRLSAVAIIGAVNELIYHWSLNGRQRPFEEVIAEAVRFISALALAD